MHPILFEIGPVTVYSYGVLLAAAYLLGLQLALVRGRRLGLDPNRIMDLGIWIILAAVVGAKLLLLLVDFDYFSRNPGELLSVVRSGGVFYGGLLAAIPVALWYMRRRRMPAWPTADVFAPCIALGHAVGRMGCLLAGCCYGRPADLPWSVTFTSTVAAENVGVPLDLPLHPTQAYEAAAALLIVGGLLLLERRPGGFPGRTFWSYILIYGITRFVIEFYRGDPRGMVFDALSTSQFISLLLVPLSLVMLARLGRRHRERAAAPPAPKHRRHG